MMPHFAYEGRRAELDLGGCLVELHNWGLAHTMGDQVVSLPKERILFAGDRIEKRMSPIFPWFPPADMEVDGIKWANVLNEFQRFEPTTIIPGPGDPGGIDIALNLASHIETVRRGVNALRTKGMSADDFIRSYKPVIVASTSNWEHAALIDGEIRYLAAQQA